MSYKFNPFTGSLDKAGGAENDSQLQLTANGINKTLKTALEDGSLAPSILDQTVTVTTPVETEWEPATFSTLAWQGLGTVTNNLVCKRQGGDLLISGKVTVGTVAAAEARIPLPLWNSSQLSSASTQKIPVRTLAGRISRDVGGAGSAKDHTVIMTASLAYLNISLSEQDGPYSPTTPQVGTTLYGSGESFAITARIPIEGWSATETTDYTIPMTQAGIIQEEDSELTAAGNAGQAIATTTDIPFITVSNKGDAINWDGDSFTVNETSTLTVSGSVRFTTAGALALYMTEDGVMGEILAYSGSNSVIYPFSTTREFKEGVVYSIRTTTANTLNNAPTHHWLKIAKQGSLKQVNVNPNQKSKIPTSQIKLTGVDGTRVGQIVNFSTVAKVQGDALEVDTSSGSGIKVKKDGLVSVSAAYLNGGTAASAAITINEAAFSTTAENVLGLGTNNAGWYIPVSSAPVPVKAGDIIRIASSHAPGSHATSHFQVTHTVPESQVSVSNTLPQFSESDLVVRAGGNSGGSVTANTSDIPFTIIEDSLGSWNGSQFTVPESGVYTITGSTYYTSATGRRHYLYVDGTIHRNISPNITDQIYPLAITEYFTAGQVVSVRVATTSTLSNSFHQHYLNITKVGKPNVTGVDVTPFVNIPQPVKQEIRMEGAAARGTTDTGIVRYTTLTKESGSGIFKLESDAALGTRITMLKRGKLNVSATVMISTGTATLSKNQSVRTNIASLTSEVLAVISGSTRDTLAWEGELEVGDVIRVSTNTLTSDGYNVLTASATANSEAIVTPVESFSTDTAPLTYASSSQYTISTLANAPVGTYITFTYAANGNVRSQTTTRPTQTDADMNTNGIRLYSRNYNATSTAGLPSTVAIQIGKGLKGFSLSGYRSAGKITATELGFVGDRTAGFESGMYLQTYDATTGILFLDCGLCNSSTTTSKAFTGVDQTYDANTYVVINASKSPALAGVPHLIPRIATIKDVKASGTAGGSSVAGWQVRTLNTLEDTSGIGITISSNQITIPAGEYDIEATVPTYFTQRSQSRFRSTDGAIQIMSDPSYSNADVVVKHRVSGRIVLSSSKVFELQMYNSLARATHGCGVEANVGGEVYSQVKIQKVK